METQAVSSSAQHAAATGRVQVEAEIPKVAPQPTPKECTYVRPFKDAFCHAGIYELRANEALSMYVEVLKWANVYLFLAARHDELNSSKPKVFTVACMTPFSSSSGLIQGLTHAAALRTKVESVADVLVAALYI